MSIKKAKKSKSKNTIVAFEAGEGFIKIVCAYRSRKGFRLLDARRIPKNDFPLEAHSLARSKAILNIPRQPTMLRFLRVPSCDEREIAGMVEIESQKQYPYYDEEVVVGYRISEKLASGYSDIVLVIARENYIKNILNSYQPAAGGVSRVCSGPESLRGWYLSIKDKEKLKDETPLVLINIDSKAINLIVLDKDRLKFSRAFDYRPKSAVEEIKKTLSSYQAGGNPPVKRAIITGAGNKLQELKGLLSGQINLPLEIVKQEFSFDCGDEFKEELRESSFVELIGVIVKGHESQINLLPRDLSRRNCRDSLRGNILKSLFLLVLLLAAASGIAAKKILDKKSEIAYLNYEISVLEPKIKMVKAMRADIRVINNLIGKKALAVNVLREIYRLTPDGIKFNLIEYESVKSLTVRGNAPSLGLVIKFTSLLGASDYFEGVKIKYTSARKGKAGEITDFEIVCGLSGRGS